MPEHAESTVGEDRYHAAREAIRDLKSAALKALVAGDEDRATQLERDCKSLCNQTFAMGLGESRFSAANHAVCMGLREGRQSLCEAEAAGLAAIEADIFQMAFGNDSLITFDQETGSNIIPFRRRA